MGIDWIVTERRSTGWITVHDPCPWAEVIAFLNQWEAEARRTDVHIYGRAA